MNISKYRLTVGLSLVFLISGCATSDRTCNQTRLITPLVVAAQKHIALVTGQDVVVTPEC